MGNLAKPREGKSEMEKAADKEKWQEARNERRRKSYHEDPSYRAARLEQSRKTYREKNGVDLPSCLGRIAEIPSYGAVRPVVSGGGTVERHCFTIKEAAEIIGPYEQQVLYRWKARGLIPEPVYQAKVLVETTGKGGSYEALQGVYLDEEVEALMRVVGEHQTRVRYYRTKDTDTIAAVFAAVEQARATIGV